MRSKFFQRLDEIKRELDRVETRWNSITGDLRALIASGERFPVAQRIVISKYYPLSQAELDSLDEYCVMMDYK